METAIPSTGKNRIPEATINTPSIEAVECGQLATLRLVIVGDFLGFIFFRVSACLLRHQSGCSTVVHPIFDFSSAEARIPLVQSRHLEDQSCPVPPYLGVRRHCHVSTQGQTPCRRAIAAICLEFAPFGIQFPVPFPEWLSPLFGKIVNQAWRSGAILGSRMFYWFLCLAQTGI